MIDWYEVFVEKRRELEEAEVQVASVERTLSQYQEMLEAAEARIAAALVQCDLSNGWGRSETLSERVRRALVLTGDTP